MVFALSYLPTYSSAQSHEFLNSQLPWPDSCAAKKAIDPSMRCLL